MGHDFKQNILVVDDSSVIHKIIKGFLKDESYNLFYAFDGKEGLKVVEEEEIHLILSDVNMPIMNGFDMCRQLKMGVYKFIPIIFLTSELRDQDIKLGYKIGANDYLSKPFERAELTFRVQNQLGIANFERSVKEDKKKHHHMAMIATLGHELNNSITVLSGALSKLKKEKKYNEDEIEKISKSKDHIVDVVKKLKDLDPSRLSYEEYAQGVDMLKI